MKRAYMSAGKAQLVLARLIGLAVAITLFFAFGFLLRGDPSMLTGLLDIALLCMLPPAVTLGLLLAGQRRLGAHVALLSSVPGTALFLLIMQPFVFGNVGGPSINWAIQTLTGLPFLYTGITLARVGIGVRMTCGPRRSARQLRDPRRSPALTTGLAEDQHEMPFGRTR